MFAAIQGLSPQRLHLRGRSPSAGMWFLFPSLPRVTDLSQFSHTCPSFKRESLCPGKHSHRRVRGGWSPTLLSLQDLLFLLRVDQLDKAPRRRPEDKAGSRSARTSQAATCAAGLKGLASKEGLERILPWIGALETLSDDL